MPPLSMWSYLCGQLLLRNGRHPLLNPQRVAYGTPAVWDRWPSGELKIYGPHYLPFLVPFTMQRDAWLVSGDRGLVPTHDLGKCTEGRDYRGRASPREAPVLSVHSTYGNL